MQLQHYFACIDLYWFWHTCSCAIKTACQTTIRMMQIARLSKNCDKISRCSSILGASYFILFKKIVYFNAHFDAFSTNIKIGIDLSTTCIVVATFKPFSSKPYPIFDSDWPRAKRGRGQAISFPKKSTIHTYKREMHVYKQKVQNRRFQRVDFGILSQFVPSTSDMQN